MDSIIENIIGQRTHSFDCRIYIIEKLFTEGGKKRFRITFECQSEIVTFKKFFLKLTNYNDYYHFSSLLDDSSIRQSHRERFSSTLDQRLELRKKRNNKIRYRIKIS